MSDGSYDLKLSIEHDNLVLESRRALLEFIEKDSAETRSHLEKAVKMAYHGKLSFNTKDILERIFSNVELLRKGTTSEWNKLISEFKENKQDDLTKRALFLKEKFC